MANFLNQPIILKRIHLIGIFLLLSAILFMLLYFQTKDKTSDFSFLPGYQEKFGEIPGPDAKEMVDYFHSSVTTMTTSSGQVVETPRAVHFDLGLLAKYMKEVALEKKATGIRVYFGRYKNTTMRPSGQTSIDYKDYITTIFVPTIDVSGYPVDIIDDDLKATLYQPYNGGISCPPLPPANCRGQKL